MNGTRNSSVPAVTCLACGNTIPRDTKWSNRYYATRLYCNRACQSSRRPSITEDYEVVESGCWEWRGHIDRNGYGKAYDPARQVGNRLDWAHRVSYRNHVGPIPAGRELDHMCENTACINPEHLQPLTKAEHAAVTMERAGGPDRQRQAAHLRQTGMTYQQIAETLGLLGKERAHARVAAAIKNGLVAADSLPEVRRLEPEDKDDIRTLYALGISQAEIGAWYRVDSSQISRLVNAAPTQRRAPRRAAA